MNEEMANAMEKGAVVPAITQAMKASLVDAHKITRQTVSMEHEDVLERKNAIAVTTSNIQATIHTTRTTSSSSTSKIFGERTLKLTTSGTRSTMRVTCSNSSYSREAMISLGQHALVTVRALKKIGESGLLCLCGV